LPNAVVATYTCEGPQTAVRILQQGDSIAFDVKISLHQESVSSPLLFVIFMNVTRALL